MRNTWFAMICVICVGYCFFKWGLRQFLHNDGLIDYWLDDCPKHIFPFNINIWSHYNPSNHATQLQPNGIVFLIIMCRIFLLAFTILTLFQHWKAWTDGEWCGHIPFFDQTYCFRVATFCIPFPPQKDWIPLDSMLCSPPSTIHAQLEHHSM